MENGFEKYYISSLEQDEDNIFFESYTTSLLFKGHRFEDRFPFHVQEVVSAVLILPLFNFTWCISSSGQTVKRPYFLLYMFHESCSLLRLQLAFIGNKLKERKLFLPYFSGWLFSNGLVKLSLAGGSHLWRQTTFDHHAQSTTLDSILEHKSNFRKFSFSSQQR